MDNCVFCKIVKGEISCKKIFEDNDMLAFLDINPFKPGHVLIIPKEHTLDFQSIDEELLSKIIKRAKILSTHIVDKMNADGYTIIQNNGNVQEVKHYHLHIIPKYIKDSTISLDEAFKKITEE